MTDRADPVSTTAAAAIVDDPQLYRKLFDTASNAMLLVDPGGIIRIANARSQELFGYTPEELTGQSIEVLMPQRFREPHVQHRERFHAAPRARPMGSQAALTARHRDGHEFAVEISLNPLSVGDRVWTCAHVRNVDRELQAKNLKIRARQATAIADFGRLALGTADFIAIQHRACALITEHLGIDVAVCARLDAADVRLRIAAQIGFDLPALPGGEPAAGQRALPDLSRSSTDPELRRLHARLQLLATADSAHLLEHPVLLEQGRDGIALHALVCAIPGEDDQILGLLLAGSRAVHSFSRDDGNFVQALANIVGAAVQREAAEARLFQSQRLEALGQLTGGVAHDFNNLLTVVSGNLQMLEEHVADNALAARLARAALRATGRGADLTRKLLAFSRRQALQPRAIDTAQLLESLVDILRRTLGAKIDVRLEVEDDLPAAHADPGMLDTALLNLAVNARDAMPDGGRLTLAGTHADATGITTRREIDPAAGQYVCITVADTGAGMAPDILARAFEPFFTTKESGKGSGLGLSLVYGFIKQSGGHIEVDSTPGAGTSIRLYLPVDSSGEAAERPTSARPGFTGGNETILVVEDDDDVRSVAAAFLRRLGYRVLQSGDATRALECIDTDQPIDLLFTDVVIRGELDGPALAREARRRRPGLRVIYTSGYPRGVIDTPDAPGRGIDAPLLAKPYRIDQLASILRRVLDRPPSDSVPENDENQPPDRADGPDPRGS